MLSSYFDLYFDDSSKIFIFFDIKSFLTAILPSISHSQAAAREPNIDEIVIDLVYIKIMKIMQ